MTGLFDQARACEALPGVRNVSVFGGFPYADVPFAGLSMLALTDGRPEAAEQICRELTDLAWSLRDQFLKDLWAPAEAVRHAMQAPRGPIILADVADNMGGGGSGDTTVLLQFWKSIAPDLPAPFSAVSSTKKSGVRFSPSTGISFLI